MLPKSWNSSSLLHFVLCKICFFKSTDLIHLISFCSKSQCTYYTSMHPQPSISLRKSNHTFSPPGNPSIAPRLGERRVVTVELIQFIICFYLFISFMFVLCFISFAQHIHLLGVLPPAFISNYSDLRFLEFHIYVLSLWMYVPHPMLILSSLILYKPVLLIGN